MKQARQSTRQQRRGSRWTLQTFNIRCDMLWALSSIFYGLFWSFSPGLNKIFVLLNIVKVLQRTEKKIENANFWIFSEKVNWRILWKIIFCIISVTVSRWYDDNRLFWDLIKSSENHKSAHSSEILVEIRKISIECGAKIIQRLKSPTILNFFLIFSSPSFSPRRDAAEICDCEVKFKA